MHIKIQSTTFLSYGANIPGEELPPLTRMGCRTIGSSEGTNVSASESLSIERVEPAKRREREVYD